MSKCTAAGVIGLGLVGMGMAVAGPLDPPAGPVAPTFKTLVEVEPRIAISAANTPGDATSMFKITQPGSYYLTGNIVGLPSKHGIEIASSGVTIDLNGFDLNGVAGSFDGVSVSGGSLRNVVVRNGSVRGWGGDGIDIVVVTGDNGAITDVGAVGNTGSGIKTGALFTLTRCTARDNAQAGIILGAGGALTNCTASGNMQNGYLLGNSCLVQSCLASANGGSGIAAGRSSVIISCTADANGSSSTGLSEGIFADVGSTIIGCTSQNNTSALTGGVGDRGMGFRVNDRCIIRDCTASLNRGHGFRLLTNCRISGCTATANGSGSTVSAGIYAAGDNNQIDGNQLTESDFGVQAIVAGNIITRNVARECGIAYSFVADNIYGPIIDRRIPTTIPGTAAVNGFAASSTLGTTDANANLSY